MPSVWIHLTTPVTHIITSHLCTTITYAVATYSSGFSISSVSSTLLPFSISSIICAFIVIPLSIAFYLIEDISFDQMQPIFMEFLKNILAKPRAITQFVPAPSNARGACSRELPQPKFSPATMMSPSYTSFENSGRTLAKARVASFFASPIVRYSAGII